jgi:hypothetical protein
MLGKSVGRIREVGESLVVTVGDSEVPADMLIMAVGVRPDSRLAKEAGLQLNARGAIAVNDHMLTSDPDIFAVGDAIEITDFVTGDKGYVPLAGPANKQGRVAADNIAGLDSAYTGTQGSSILKVFDLTVAATGVNEKTAKRLKLNYDKSFTYSANHAGYYPGAVNMSIKMIFEKNTGKILGAQAVGYDGTDKRIDVIATAIRAGNDRRRPHQAGALLRAALRLREGPGQHGGLCHRKPDEGLVKNFHWHDVSGLCAGRQRDAVGYPHGAGVRKRPHRRLHQRAAGSLRSRLGELDKSKPCTSPAGGPPGLCGHPHPHPERL